MRLAQGLLSYNSAMRKLRSICVLLLLAIAAGLNVGCATHTPMVSFAPTQTTISRNSGELLADLNRSMPFEVSAGDFVANKAIDGTACWICFNDVEKTRALLAFLDKSSDWRFRAVGYVAPRSRRSFGLAAQPGSTLTGASASVMGQPPRRERSPMSRLGIM